MKAFILVLSILLSAPTLSFAHGDAGFNEEVAASSSDTTEQNTNLGSANDQEAPASESSLKLSEYNVDYNYCYRLCLQVIDMDSKLACMRSCDFRYRFR